MSKRLTRRLVDVATEVEAHLKAHFGLTDKELQGLKTRIQNTAFTFPKSEMMKAIELWIDYEVQRDVIHKHVLGIMRKWDPRVCSPASSCKVTGLVDDAGAPIPPVTVTYDGQHRILAAVILGYVMVPCSYVETADPAFPSYAFEMLNQTGTKRLTPGDIHRNALVRYKLGSREKSSVEAYKMQLAFDECDVDLEDKNTRNNPNLAGERTYFFSHFKYAMKVMELEKEGDILRNILKAITSVFPTQEEVDQGTFIGLYELQRLAGNKNTGLPDDWMTQVLTLVKNRFKNSHGLHDKCKSQFAHKFPGATWSAPSAMSEFIRELYIMEGGTLSLPSHGVGACLDVATNPAPGLFPLTISLPTNTTPFLLDQDENEEEAI